MLTKGANVLSLAENLFKVSAQKRDLAPFVGKVKIPFKIKPPLPWPKLLDIVDGPSAALKYVSEEKDTSLCRCSILLSFIMSKNLRGL